jgi:hypothetical protein
MNNSLNLFEIYSEGDFKIMEKEFTYIFQGELPLTINELIEELCILSINYEFSLASLKKKLQFLNLDLDPLTLRKLYCFLFAYDLAVNENFFTIYRLNRSIWNLSIVRKNPQACFGDKIPGAKGRFAFDPTNPIPVYGFLGSKVYLENLCSLSHDDIYINRLGSLQVDGIHQMIDRYEVQFEEDEPCVFIYLSLYHWKNSSLAPEGFMLLRDF